jgi:hypothetical protein
MGGSKHASDYQYGIRFSQLNHPRCVYDNKYGMSVYTTITLFNNKIS